MDDPLRSSNSSLIQEKRAGHTVAVAKNVAFSLLGLGLVGGTLAGAGYGIYHLAKSSKEEGKRDFIPDSSVEKLD
jgi:hypothetical protein